MVNLLEDEIQDFFRLLCRNNVRFILVGGLAVNHYGFSRTTGDVDLWLEDNSENRAALVEALQELGIEGAEVFMKQPLLAGFAEIMLDSGVYIDLMASLQSFKQDKFSSCYEISSIWELDMNTKVRILRLNDLIEEKEKSKRDKDKSDSIELKSIRDSSSL